jgi:hypothetical protein
MKMSNIAKTLSYVEPAHEASGRVLVLDEEADWTAHAGPTDIIISKQSDGWWITFIGEDGEASSWNEPCGDTAEQALDALRSSGMAVTEDA